MSDRRLRDRVSAVFRGQDELDLTSGSIAEPLFYLSLPIIVTNLLQVAYNIADTFWLGQYSTEALAAITFSFPMIFFLISLGLGISVAGSVLVAQHTGAGEHERAEYAASQVLSYSLIAAVLLGGTGFLFVEEFLRLIGAAPSVLPAAAGYLRIVSLGLVSIFGFIVFTSLMRGAGDTITPMLVMFGTVVLNVALDPFLIFGVGPLPRMGVEGAAVATVFSRGLAALFGIGILLRGDRGASIDPRKMVPDLSYLGKIARLGGPSSVEVTARSISVNVMLAVVGTFSVPVVAAFGVGVRIFSLIFMPAIAVDRGVETMTGQNIGAGEPDRAARANHFAAKASFVVLAVLGVVVFFAAPTVVGVFDDNPEVVRVGADFLQWVAPTFGFIGVLRAYSGGFRGAGRTLTAATIVVLMLWVVRIPVALAASRVVDVSTLAVNLPVVGTVSGESLAGGVIDRALAVDLQERGIWFAFAVSNTLGAIIATGWFLRGGWRDTDPVDDPSAAPADD